MRTRHAGSVTCCIAGGGPAGMMLGYLLARAGIDVLVLEKHADFLRDFRGDTVHPSTLQILRELGVLEAFLARPHQEVRQISGRVAGVDVQVADFTHLKTGCPFIAFMPQWHFLDFLAEQGRRFPGFRVMMQAEVVGLVEGDGRVAGVRVSTPAGLSEIRADLVIGADGRNSVVRSLAGLEVENLGAPIDVLWMRLSRLPHDPHQALGIFERGMMFVMLDRGDYWQCAYVIPKGAYAGIRGQGLATLRARIVAAAPFLGDRVAELSDWEKISLLTVRVDRLRRWFKDGLLCLGDAAHAMSPVGGVGINLAIQDAVAAANLLAPALKAKNVRTADLAAVQSRRELPTRLVQRAQVFAHKHVIGRALDGAGWQSPPWPFRLLQHLPLARRIPAYLIGVGIRPEHVQTFP